MSKALKDSSVIVSIIIASVLVYWDSLKLRPGSYDPLGSGTMPRIVAGSIIALSLVALLQTFFGKPVPVLVVPGMPEEAEFERRPWLAIAVSAFLVAYVVMIWLRWPFGLSSSLFLFVSTLAIRRFSLGAVLPAAALSLTFGYALTYLFGTLFGVDLP